MHVFIVGYSLIDFVMLASFICLLLAFFFFFYFFRPHQKVAPMRNVEE